MLLVSQQLTSDGADGLSDFSSGDRSRVVSIANKNLDDLSQNDASTLMHVWLSESTGMIKGRAGHACSRLLKILMLSNRNNTRAERWCISG
jgi:hypothetical protein